MLRPLTILAASVALLSGAAVLQLKLSVQEQSERVERLAKKIHKDREAIRVLEAEWSHLTTPSLLQDRSIRFMALMPPASTQIIDSPLTVPYRLDQNKTAGPDEGVLLPQQKRDDAKVRKFKRLHVRFNQPARALGDAL